MATYAERGRQGLSRPPTAAAKKTNPPSDFGVAQVDGLVLMNITKHSYEHRNNIETARGSGGLLGAVMNGRLEITNTFPFPLIKVTESGDEDSEYTPTLLLHMQKLNQDALNVGWYQNAELGSFATAEFVLTLFDYMEYVPESVALIYDFKKTNRGTLGLKAYRLAPETLKMFREAEEKITPGFLKSLHLSYEKMFQEIPIVFNNSLLASALCSEIATMKPEKQPNLFLDLGMTCVLEPILKGIYSSIDESIAEAYKLKYWSLASAKLEEDKVRFAYKRQLENAARELRGDVPLPDDNRSLPVPPRTAALLSAAQTHLKTNELLEYCIQAIGKLFLAQTLQPPPQEKPRRHTMGDGDSE